MTRFRGLSVAALAAALVACVDTDPIAMDEDSGALDGAPDDALGLLDAPIEACRACLTTGPCKPVNDACDLLPKCASYVNCSIDVYCLNYSSADLANLPACTNKCAMNAGVTGQDDPAIPAYVGVFFCAQDPSKCGPVCNVGGPPAISFPMMGGDH